MPEQNIFWSLNIKYLRSRKHMSQGQLSTAMGISPSKLNAHEHSVTVNPTLNDLLDFSQYFKISVDVLLTVDLSRLGSLKMRELEAGNDVYITGSKIRILAATVDKDNKEQVDVAVKAKAGYRPGLVIPNILFRCHDLPRS